MEMLWPIVLVIMLDCSQSYGTYTVDVNERCTARLECRTTVRSSVDWKKELDPRAPGTYIVVGGRMMPKYRVRFEFNNDTYTLTIHNANLNDSGLYYCIEDKGAGQQHFVRLNVDFNECASSPCLNGGTCINGKNNYTCSCQAGYNGDNCQTDINECLSSPCLNGGTCTDEKNKYTCSCPAGYTGDTCHTVTVGASVPVSLVICVVLLVVTGLVVGAVVLLGSRATHRLSQPDASLVETMLDSKQCKKNNEA